MNYLQGFEKPKFDIRQVVIISGTYTGHGDVTAYIKAVTWSKLLGAFFYDLVDGDGNTYYCNQKFLSA